VAVREKDINEVFASAWEAAVHEKPMLLARHSSEAVIVRVRQAIQELLAQGCSVTEARERIIAGSVASPIRAAAPLRH
jgi:hypothetical protein